MMISIVLDFFALRFVVSRVVRLSHSFGFVRVCYFLDCNENFLTTSITVSQW